ncbi:hypothetical protein K523DRAFT_30699 [Schizophyllum commune Tattone D]|nr:hypothetical protein K523DRAFT_30699 [Schizophyllum commune Tattone D]
MFISAQPLAQPFPERAGSQICHLLPAFLDSTARTPYIIRVRIRTAHRARTIHGVRKAIGGSYMPVSGLGRHGSGKQVARVQEVIYHHHHHYRCGICRSPF